MLKESTIRKQKQELRRFINRINHPEASREAYAMATALQWVLGGCSWNCMTTIREILARQSEIE